MKNIELRALIKNAGLFHWELAELLGISEFTLCKWLRKELTATRQKEIKKIITEYLETKGKCKWNKETVDQWLLQLKQNLELPK